MAVGLTGRLFGHRVKAQSAGVDAAVGAHAAINAVRAMEEIGIDISAHRPRDISSIDLSGFDYVIAMDPGIAEVLEEMGLTEGINLIVWNVADPYGRGVENYRKTAATIKGLLSTLGKDLIRDSRPEDRRRMDGLR